MSDAIEPKTLVDLGWDKLVAHLGRRTHTARGAAAAAELPLFDTPDQASARMLEIAEARHLMAIDAAMPFGGIRDVVTQVARAGKGGVLDAQELVDTGSTARGLGRLRRHLDHHQGEIPRLADRAAVIADLRHVYQPILDSFDETGRLADHASDALGPLRRKASQIAGQLEQRIRSYVEDQRNHRFLQDRYFTTRDDRYVVPVRHDARSQVRGIVHGTSQSGRTLFIEPEPVVELQNALRLAQCEVEDEERRIMAELSALVGREEHALRQSIDAATVLDVIDASARLADDLVASVPAISSQRRVSLLHARHPLMLLADRPCVPNDIVLEPGTILILSGPNAGGKTVALKTAGLCALMTRAGLHLPAESGSETAWFTSIHSDIGDSQSIENDLSTFSGHLANLRQYLTEADAGTLLLIDEVAVGTEPEQGAALAQAVLEALAARGAAAIATTHYERLKALGASDPRFANASVGFDLERMEPTFRLHLGVPGSSGALAVARRMGLPPAVVDEAEGLLGQRRASVEELLATLSDERRKLVEEREALARARAEAEAARAEAEAARRAARERERTAHEAAHSEAVAALRQARDELDRTRAEIKRRIKVTAQAEGDAARAERQTEITALKSKLSEIADAVSEHAPGRALPEGVRALTGELRPGTAVYVTSLGSRGQVVESPQRGRVAVQVGTMRTTVAVDDVLLDTRIARARQAGAAPASAKASGKRGEQRSEQRDYAAAAAPAPASPDDMVLRTNDITVDVRGARADEAVDAVDRFIDQCMVSHRDVVFVIHGHGTGALRSAIRGHLEAHHAVARWRPGQRAEGGDGVTIAWLDVA
jgi:DNA mismatch repair protein MutS2